MPLSPGETHLCRCPPAGSAGWLAGRLHQRGAHAAAPGADGGGRFRATVSNRAVQLPKQNHSVRKPRVAKNSRRVPTWVWPCRHKSGTQSSTACSAKANRFSVASRLAKPWLPCPKLRLSMETLHGAVLADVAGGALVAVNRVRAVDLETVQSDQQATADTLERGQGSVLAERVEVEREQLSEAVGAQPVEQIANAVIARDGLDAEERLAIGARGFLLHPALELEERARLEEEDRKGAGNGVGEGVALVAAAAWIRQGGCCSAEGVQHAA